MTDTELASQLKALAQVKGMTYPDLIRHIMDEHNAKEASHILIEYLKKNGVDNGSKA